MMEVAYFQAVAENMAVAAYCYQACFELMESNIVEAHNMEEDLVEKGYTPQVCSAMTGVLRIDPMFDLEGAGY